MRIRNNPQASILLAKSQWVISPQQFQLKGWQMTIFGNLNPIDLEIGIGKGKFLIENAEKNPHRNFLGIEKNQTILWYANQKYIKSTINQPNRNCYAVNTDAKDLLLWLPPSTISRIYLNFSDPWLKKRHQKRRLTAPNFLAIYQQLLTPNGQVYFKTDNVKFFNDSLNYFSSLHWKLIFKTYDLSHSVMASSNIETEYEIKFKKQKKPIYLAIFAKTF